MKDNDYKVITIGITNYGHRVKYKNVKYFYISYFIALTISAFALYFSDKIDISFNLYLWVIVGTAFLGIGTPFIVEKKMVSLDAYEKNDIIHSNLPMAHFILLLLMLTDLVFF